VELYLNSPYTPSSRGAQLKKKAQGKLYILLEKIWKFIGTVHWPFIDLKKAYDNTLI
jgi:hypothetical protein